MSKRYSGKSFKDSSVMKKPKFSLKKSVRIVLSGILALTSFPLIFNDTLDIIILPLFKTQSLQDRIDLVKYIIPKRGT